LANILELKDNVGRWLREANGDVRLSIDGDGYFMPFEDFGIEVLVGEHTDPEIVEFRQQMGLPLMAINIKAWVSKGIKPSLEFYKFVSEEMPSTLNLQLGVQEDVEKRSKAVFVFCSIPGETLDAQDLKWAVHTVFLESMVLGRELKEKFGAKWVFESR
jgi:hypothetical protein